MNSWWICAQWGSKIFKKVAIIKNCVCSMTSGTEIALILANFRAQLTVNNMGWSDTPKKIWFTYFFIDIFSLPIIFWFADDVAPRADNLKIQTLNFCLVCLNTAGKEILKSLAAKKNSWNQTKELHEKFLLWIFSRKIEMSENGKYFPKIPWNCDSWVFFCSLRLFKIFFWPTVLFLFF